MQLRRQEYKMILKYIRKNKKAIMKFSMSFMLCCFIFLAAVPAYAGATGSKSNVSQQDTEDSFHLNITSNAGSTTLESTLQMLLILTALSLAPSIIIMVTSFTRIIVVFHFLRTALGTQTTPPNQVLIGLALFITLAIMSPVMTKVNKEAVQPYMNGKVKQEQAIEKGLAPIRTFMLKQTRDKDLKLFMTINDQKSSDVKSYDDIPTTTIIPAFIISELRTAFIIGFLIYLPFIVIDMVVASTLMSMGMMMLPPTTISLPFKILLFILADGWNLVVGQLVESFK